jgi:isoleucyl-tRNA synthetase
VGSSLQAELEFYVGDKDFESLQSLEDDLRFVMITSKAIVYRVPEQETKIVVKPSSYQKCDRCWHYRADVGSDAAHPSICGRCVSNLFGKGEARKYA